MSLRNCCFSLFSRCEKKSQETPAIPNNAATPSIRFNPNVTVITLQKLPKELIKGDWKNENSEVKDEAFVDKLEDQWNDQPLQVGSIPLSDVSRCTQSKTRPRILKKA